MRVADDQSEGAIEGILGSRHSAEQEQQFIPEDRSWLTRGMES
jgi:hypothetical protein